MFPHRDTPLCPLGPGRVSSARGGLVQTPAGFENGPAGTGKRWQLRCCPTGTGEKNPPGLMPGRHSTRPLRLNWAT